MDVLHVVLMEKSKKIEKIGKFTITVVILIQFLIIINMVKLLQDQNLCDRTLCDRQ